jgi:2-polyprenyl-3-methyl-5-hydroxy-6-metoxy-1,4-benzoquinol methylase
MFQWAMLNQVRLMIDTSDSGNLLFQSEHHPLVPLEFESRESYCLSLIHRKAYSRAAEMADGLDVLDLGCNNGYGTMSIAKRCAKIIGVDVAAHAIEAAVATHAGPNIEYRLVDGSTLPFSAKTFDLVTSFQVIEHVADVEPYLREIRRVLRDTGKAVFTTPNRCIRLDAGMEPWNRFHVREYDAAALRETLSAVFPHVLLEGLFAAPTLYKIEHDRAGRGKAAARKRRSKTAARNGRIATSLHSLKAAARTAVVDGAKAALPNVVVRRLSETFSDRSAVKPVEEIEREALADFIARWSISDLFYRDEGLDEALDLIALCSLSTSTNHCVTSVRC